MQFSWKRIHEWFSSFNSFKYDKDLNWIFFHCFEFTYGFLAVVYDSFDIFTTFETNEGWKFHMNTMVE